MENIKEYCKKWFEDNNIECPRFAKDWKGVGRNIPPKTSLTALTKLNLKPADIINYIYGSNTAKTNKTHKIDYDQLGLKFISRISNGNGHYSIEYICLNCGESNWTDQGTIVRWKDRNVKFCPTCRGSSGKEKTAEYYQSFVLDNFNVYDKVGRHVKVQCLDCGFLFTRSIAQLQQKETDNICCPNCDTDSKYVKGKTEKYASLIEKELSEYCQGLVLCSLQVSYSSFCKTDRNFVADIFIEEINTVLEITSKSNNLPGYYSRIEEKANLCRENNIHFYVVTTKNEIKDIVRSLLKDKET